MSGNELKIKTVVQTYVDGYLNAERDLVEKAFNGETRLYSIDDGEIDKTEMSAWLENLDDRKLRGDIRNARFEIAMMDITVDTAVVKLFLHFEKRRFTDYLSLLNKKGDWTIVGKIYSVSEV